MAVTWTKALVPARVIPEYVIMTNVLVTAEISLGSLVIYDKSSNHNISDEVDAAADDASILGIALGESKTGSTDPIPVMVKGMAQATLVSAAYGFGAGLKYDDTADDGSLVADGDANTIAWFWSTMSGHPSASASITKGFVWVDFMFAMSGKTSALWDPLSD